MSLELAIPFELFGTSISKLLDGVYAQVTNNDNDPTEIALVADPDPVAVAGSKAVRFPVPNGSSLGQNWYRLRYALRTAVDEGGYAHNFWCSGLPSVDGDAHKVEFRSDTNTIQFGWYLMTTGQLRVYNAALGILGTTALPVITTNTWHHIETKYSIHDTTGSVEIRVNGAEAVLIENVDTKGPAGTTVAQIEHFVEMDNGLPGVGGGVTYIKNPIFWNTLGSTNNDFMGSCSVLWLPVDGDVSLNWTPSSGSTGYNLIGVTPPNDANYIEADDSPPAAAEFTFENLPPDITSVRGLIMMGRQWKVDGGDAQTQMSLESSGSDDDGADRALTIAPTYTWDVSEVSPDTAAAWTPVEVDAATIKINRTV